MGEKGRTPRDSVVEEAILYENVPISDENFGEDFVVASENTSTESLPKRVLLEEFYEYDDPLESLGNSTSKSLYPGGMKGALIAYLKRNALVLTILLALWLIVGVDYMYTTYRIPVIGGILSFFNREPLGSFLRYITATRSGPMSYAGFMKPTFAGYVAAFVGKTLYILTLTGLLIPLFTSLFKKDKTLTIPFSKNTGLFVRALTDIKEQISNWSLVLMGSGFAFILSNIVTRNGKIDKSFMPLLLAFVVFAGLSGPLPALIDYITRKFLSLVLKFVPHGLENSFEKMTVLKIGLILGFLVSIPTGQFAERANYTIGILLLIVGAGLSLFFKKESPHELS
ncbi:hypothetical protein [Fusibacter tunisiensis]|uniref:Uncharacterized protein n=1 Tax=Fusibacter tunisiensis TaxID=1008308 RepID=A0ABS2MP04_9FIRM|nr:hypothetical protein [Fusibacter tunisiensis]MBM7561130.1 hypothetical protein [Fusibacter tunisiensis]